MKIYKENKILIAIVAVLTLIFFILLGVLLFLPRHTTYGPQTASVLPPEQKVSETNTTPVAKYIKKIPPPPTEAGLFHYVEIVDSCGPFYNGVCVNMRSGPGLDYSVVARLRNGTVLKVGEAIENNDQYWYRVILDEWIRYPERVTSDWYVSANYTQSFFNEGTKDLIKKDTETTNKYILVDLSEQTLYAYEGSDIYMKEPISAGLDESPTPIGTFTIFRKTPSRYMQGPLEIPSITTETSTSTEAITSTSTVMNISTSTESVVSPNVKSWDLPGVPWNLYFTVTGSVIHGAYWHNFFGGPASNGCVNMRPEKAKILYYWADLGTQVIIQN
jgi:lipoprotein-anchoring transpeptidase ErfK/SrfK